MVKNILLGVGVLVVLLVAFALYRSMRTPSDLWGSTGTFASCPNRPSCVSSVAKDEIHAIAPLSYSGEPRLARERLEAVIRAMPDTRILEARPEYLHVLFVTPTMRFRDDVELLVQPGGVVQVRSISRFGYGDLGVNRARVEAIRTAFAKAASAPTQ